MSSTDKRVVVLEFDNDSFEKGVAQTLQSLKNLEKSVNNTEEVAKSLSKLNSVDFNEISSSLDSIQSRFSTLGVIGMTVIQNLTNSAIDAAKNIAGSLTSAITQGGINRSFNIEHAKFQLEGLGVAWNDISDDIDYAVKDTAYGLDAAAMAASQLVASGVEFGDTSDDMRTALRAISGVAAMTNSEYSDVAHIFTTVAGNGRLMGIQLTQLANRGLNAAATIGDYLGIAEEDVRSMASAGKISFQLFADAMDNAFGEHAKDSNKTFDGAMSNIRAALARTGQAFIQPAIENRYYYEGELKNLVDVLNGFRVVVNGVNSALGPLADKVEEVMHKVSAKALEKLEWLYSKDYWTGEITDNITGPISNAIEIFLNVARNIYLGITQIVNGIKIVFGIIKDVLEETFPDVKTFGEYLTDFSLRFRSRAADLFKLIISHADKIKGIIRIFISTAGSLIRIIKGIIEILKPILLNTIVPVLKGVAGVILNIVSHFGDLSKRISDSLIKFSGFTKLSEKLKEKLGPIGSAITKIFEIINSKIDSIAGAFSSFFDTFERYKKQGRSTSDALSKAFEKLEDKIRSKGGAWKKLADVMEFFRTKIAKASEASRTFIDNVKTSFIESDNANDAVKQLSESLIEQGGGWKILGGFIEQFRRIIEKVWPPIKKFGENVGQTFVNIKDAIKKAFSKSDKDTDTESFGDRVVNGFSKINDFAESSGIADKIKGIFDKIGETLKNIDWLSILENIGNVFSTIGNVLKSVWKGLKKGWEVVKPIFDEIKNIIINLWNEVTGGADLLDVVARGGAIGLIITIITFLNRVKDTFKGFDSIKNSFKGILDNAAGVLESVRGVFVKYQESIKADILKKIAISIGVIAASVILLSLIDSEKLVVAVGALITLMAALSRMFELFGSSDFLSGDNLEANLAGAQSIQETIKGFGSALSKGFQSSKMGSVFVKIALAILIIVNSVKKLADLNPIQIITGVAAIGAIIGELVFMMSQIAKYSDQSVTFIPTIDAVSKAMIKMAAAIAIVAFVVTKLAKVEPERLVVATVAISALMAGLTIMATELGKLDGSDLSKAGWALIMFSAAIGILALSAKLIATIGWPDLGKFGAVLVAFTAVVIGFSKLADSSKLSASLGAFLVLFSASLILLSGAIFVISKIPWEGLGKFGTVLAGFTLVLASFSRLVKPKQLASAVGPIFALTGAMVALALVLKLYSNFSWTTLAIAGAALAGFAAIMLGLTFVLSKIKGATSNLIAFGVAATGFGIAMLGIGAGLYLFSLSIDHLAESAYKIPNIIVTVVEGIAKVSSRINRAVFDILDSIFDVLLQVLLTKIPQFGEAALTMILTGLTLLNEHIVEIADKFLDIVLKVLDRLEKKIPEIAEKVFSILGKIGEVLITHIKGNGAENFAIIVGSMVGITALLHFLGKNKKTFIEALPALGVVALAMVAIGGIISLMSLLDTSKMLEASLALSTALIALAGATSIITQIGQLGAAAVTGALYGIAALAIIIGGLQTIAITLVATTYGLMEAIRAITGDESLDFVQIIDEASVVLQALGEAIGNFIGGIVGGFAEATLPALGQSLSDFMTNFQPFIEGANNINDNTIKGIESLVGIILALSAAELIDALANNPLLTFGGGGKSFTDFLEEAQAFIVGMADIAEDAANISADDATNIRRAAVAGKAMAEFAASIPNSGKDGFNIASFILGDNDMDDFGEMMKSFVGCLIETSAALEDGHFGKEAVDRIKMAAEAGTAMTEFAKTIPNSSRDGFNLASFILGDNDMDTFGDMMKSFAECLMMVSSKLQEGRFGDTQVERIKKAAEAGKAMTEFAKTIPNSGKDGFNIASFILGDNDMDTFGGMMDSFASCIVNVASTLLDFRAADQGRIALAAVAGDDLAELAKKIGIVKDNDHSVSNLGYELESFGESLSIFADDIEGINFSSLNESTGSITQFTLAVNELAGNSIADFEQAFITAKTTTALIINEWLQTCIDTITPDTFREIGTDCVNAFKEGLGSKQTVIGGTASRIVNKVLSTVEGADLKGNGYNQGSNFTQGLINGMNSKAWLVESTARAIAKNSIIKTTYNALDENSPSKIAYEQGAYYGIGMAKGLDSQTNNVADSTETLGHGILDSAQYMISRILDVINSNDANPVITPVMDLSSFQNGMDYINGNINSQRFNIAALGYDLSSSIGSVSPRANFIENAYNDNNVIKEIRNLNDRIDTLSNSMSNMQMVLDTGVLVGEISQPINKSLGRLSVKANRGG